MKKKNLLLTAVATLGFTIATWAQVPNYVPSNGLVGWWPFNGNANDESGNGNDGTVNGATLTEDRLGNLNSAYSFNGTNNDIVIVDNATLDLTNFSISAWVELPAYNSLGDEILTKGGDLFENYEILIYGSPTDSGTVETAIKWTDGTRSGINSVTGNQHISLNVWSLITSTYDVSSGKLRMYINGLFVTEQTPNKTPQVNNLNLYFGHDPSAGRYHLGLIDDIGIWNRALTQEEITALYTSCNLNANITPNPANVAIGASASLMASSIDANASYQWQSNPSGFGWQNVPSNATYNGATSNALGVTNVQLGNHNQAFRVIATSGNCADTSDVATINVLDTCITNVIDTTFVPINDTTFITINDTITTQVFDTITTQVFDTTYISETIYDTITTQIFDTITTQIFDTTYVTQTIYDTLYVTETIYDTTYVTVNDTNYTYISVTDTLVINTTLGLAPNQQQNTIKVFPNPASTQITIDYDNFGLMNGYLVKITNNLGQIVYSANITQQSVTLNLGDWTGDGLYHLELFDAQGNVIENRKIVLQ